MAGMRYMGIDYGEKRIGIAFSDEGGMMAFPKAVMVYKNSAKAAADIAVLIKKECIVRVILGLPRSLQGRDTVQTEVVRKFANALKKRISIPIEFEDEMLTTKIAVRSTPKDKLDAASAAVILQSYLDRNIK